MKTALRVSIVALFTLTAPLAASADIASSADGSAVAAESAALAWLGLFNAGSYSQSWSAASPLFREHISESQWRTRVAVGRPRLGALKSRKLVSEACVRTVRGLPDGDYVIVNFSSRYLWWEFEPMFETVLVTKDADGIWRVADYYIADDISGLSADELSAPPQPCK
jgi:Protein of unknown function (DUF4019)